MIVQLIYLALVFLEIGLSIAKHGQPKTGKYNFWVSVISNAIIIFVLLKGGFFDVMINN